MPIPSNPTPLAGVIGASADVLPIPAQDYTDPTQNGALNYATGWPAITALPLEAGGKAPRREYFNALTQLMSSHIFFQQSGSLYTWSGTLDYLTGAHVLGSDGKEYIAQKSNGPDVPDSSAVDPVGDDSGTWLAAGSVYAPLATTETPGIMRPDGETCVVVDGVLSSRAFPYNTRVVITESDAAWSAPVTGWAQITLIGGGGGGSGGGGDAYTACAGGSGGGGERKVVYVYLTEGSTYACTIGAGGAGGVSNATGNATPVAATLGKAGGVTKFVAGSVTYTAEGGGGAGSFNLFGFGDAGVGGGSGETAGLSGIRGVFNTGGNGALTNQYPSGAILSGYGSGGLGGAGGNPAGISGLYNAGPGNQGAIIIDYYDPQKETA